MVSVRSDGSGRGRTGRRGRRAAGALLAGTALLAAVTVAGCGLVSGGDEASAPGVTEEPCPKAVNEDHGCIYLGIISDLTSGPFKSMGVSMVAAQKAFWDRVNKQGGIGGYDIDVHTFVRDNKYDPATHRRAFLEMKDKVLALAQSLGSPTTEAILGDLRSARMIAVPGSFPSRWEFEDVILESGASYCFEAMNAVDYAADRFDAESVMAVYYPGDYGGDAAAGAKSAAAARGLRFSGLETAQGADKQEAVVQAILARRPDMVVVTVGPAEAAAIVAGTVSRGYRGRFMGNNPTWAREILRSPAAAAMKSRFLHVAPWKPFAFDSPGHTAMRQALGRAQPNDVYTTGWITSYPLKTVLEKAAANGRLNREGLYEALGQTTTVDYEGMLPKKAGDFSGSPNAAAYRESVIAVPDEREFTGTKVTTDFTAGPTSAKHRLTQPCYKPA